ncbi:hypothetical protein D3C78_1379300 [compost metagenome]
MPSASSGTAMPPRAPPKPPLDSPVSNTAGRPSRRNSVRDIEAVPCNTGERGGHPARAYLFQQRIARSARLGCPITARCLHTGHWLWASPAQVGMYWSVIFCSMIEQIGAHHAALPVQRKNRAASSASLCIDLNKPFWLHFFEILANIARQVAGRIQNERLAINTLENNPVPEVLAFFLMILDGQ